MKRFVSWCLAVAVVAGAWIIPVQAINVGIVIQAEEYISGGEGIGYHDTTPGLDDKWAIDRGDDVEILAGNSGMVVSFQATEWMNYQVAVPQSGRYRLSVEYSSVGYVDGYQNELEVIINGHKQIGQHFGTTETWKKYRSEVLGEITLVSGENEIKLRNRGDGGISFDSFRLEQVGQISMEKEQEILLALNSTENSRSVLEQYQHEIGINVNQMLEGIWYSDAIFHGMCGVGFTTLTQVTDELTRQVKLERSNPQVSLICDENVVNTLQSGQLRFQLAFQRIRQEITAMVAIYRDEVLEQVRRGQVGTDGVGTLDFGRMEFQPKSNYTVKVFLWEDLTQMHPYLPWDDRDVIYVAPYGSNSGDGSVSAPYKTIAKAQSEVRKCNKNMERDMEVRIYPGEYPITSGLNFTSSDSGTNGYRVTYRGANPVEMPTINGGRRIENWVKDGDLWKAATPTITDMRQLYVDDVRARRGRSEVLYKGLENYDDLTTVQTEDGFTVENLPPIADPTQMELVWNLDWTNQRLPVKSVIRQDGKQTIVMQQPYYEWGRTKEYERTNPGLSSEKYEKKFYLENARELVDQPGEFFFDKKTQTIYYYAEVGQDPNELDCFAGAVQGMVKVVGVENVTLDNLSLQYGTWLQPNTQGICITQGDKMVNKANDRIGHGGSMMDAQVKVTDTTSFVFSNNRVTHMGSAGIGIEQGVTNTQIKGNTFEDLSAGGVIVGSWEHNLAEEEPLMCKNVEVMDNRILDISREYHASPAISAYYVNHVSIAHNEIKNTPYTGISVGWGWGEDVKGCSDNNIVGNRVEDVVNTIHDGAHIYTLGPMRNSEISGNYLVKSGDSRGGIYTDEGSGYIKVSNNVVKNCYYWLYIWTASIHDIQADNNYTDTERYLNLGTNTTVTNTTVVIDEKWTKEAKEIMNNAGPRI